MRAVFRLLIRQTLVQRRRLVGVTLAIAIGTAFLTATLLFGPVLDAAFHNRVGAEYRHVDLIVSATVQPLTDATVDRIQGVEGVAGVEPQALVSIDASGRGSAVYLTGSAVPAVPSLVDAQEILAGRLPTQPGEIAVSEAAARQLQVASGEAATFQVPVDPATGIESEPRAFTVSGIYGSAGRFGEQEVGVYLTTADLALWSPDRVYGTAFVIAEPGVSPESLAEPVAAAAGTGASVLTAEQRIDEAVAEFETASRIQSLALSAFAIVALVVAGFVISNTFAILVAQRTRELALFRCLGATARQVRGLVLGEALLIGLAGSAIGIAVSMVGTQALLALLGRTERFDVLPSRVGPEPVTVFPPLLAGTGLALLAAWGPAREATRVAPLQALRTFVGVAQSRSPGRLRAVLTLLLLGAGGALLGLGLVASRAGAQEIGVLIGLAGGTVAAFGVLAGALFVVPPAFRLAGRIVARPGDVPARVSVTNGLRNPRRTTATATALMIGATLVAMMATGAATLRATLAGEIDATAPIDLEASLVRGDDPASAGLRPAFVDSAATIDGVAAIAAVSNVPISLTAGGVEHPEVYVDGVEPAAADVGRDPGFLGGLQPGLIAVPEVYAEAFGWGDGSGVTATAGDASVPLTVHVVRLEGDPVIARADLDRLVPDTGTTGLWLRLDDDTDSGPVMDALYDLADRQGVRIEIGGNNEYRSSLVDALNTMLYVVTGLLLAAIAIAIVGVGNTLSLSAVERSRESALLRTLGFTRTQLRTMLAIEGVLIAGVGGLLGVLLGVIFGWIGAMTLIGDAWDVALRLPLGWLAGTLLIAVLSGWLASVLPARRVAREDPVVALAGTEVTT